MTFVSIASTFILVTFLLATHSQKSLGRPFSKSIEFLDIPQPVRGRRQVQTSSACNCFSAENWWGHNENLVCKRRDKDDKLIMFVEDNYSYEVQKWVFDFTKRVWEYMSTIYADSGLRRCLHMMIHSARYAGVRIVHALNSSSIPANFNILDIGSTNPNAWKSNGPNMDEMNLITNYLAHFVEFSSKNRFGSVSENIWKSSSSEHSAWVDIFTYDVYKSLKYTANAELYKNKSLLKSHNSSFSTNETFWFRDWLLPIYEQFGGNSVLNNYFKILGEEIPPSKENLNIGEFVHLWCGAARSDLTSIAENAFGWNEDYEELFTKARLQFSGITNRYLFNSTRYSRGLTTSSPNTEEENGRTTGEAKYFHTSTPSLEETNTTKVPETSSFKDTQALLDDSSQRQLIIGIIAGGIVIFVLFTALLIFVFHHKKTVQNLKTEMRSLTNKELRDFFHGDSSANENEAQSLIHSIPFVKDFEVSRDRLIFNHDNVIGSGEYGCVMNGFFRQLDSEELLPVAIKTVKANVEVSQFKAMLLEAKIMAYLGKHENIVLLCATYTANIRNREIYIALELCTLGDLRNFLKNNAKEYKHQPFPATPKRNSNSNEVISSDSCMSTLNLYKWSHNIANGMMYLAEKKVIHGDLAARNVLLTSNHVAKISDFGLSRQLLNYAHYLKTARTPLPWRWMAVESMKDMQFSVASDVWAFGVTLWEIFSLGETPYPGWTWDYTFVDKLVLGDRLQAPAYSNNSLYELMHDCWNLEPAERPSFQTIHNILGELVIKHSTTSSSQYVELFPLETETESESESETETDCEFQVECKSEAEVNKSV